MVALLLPRESATGVRVRCFDCGRRSGFRRRAAGPWRRGGDRRDACASRVDQAADEPVIEGEVDGSYVPGEGRIEIADDGPASGPRIRPTPVKSQRSMTATRASSTGQRVRLDDRRTQRAWAPAHAVARRRVRRVCVGVEREPSPRGGRARHRHREQHRPGPPTHCDLSIAQSEQTATRDPGQRAVAASTGRFVPQSPTTPSRGRSVRVHCRTWPAPRARRGADHDAGRGRARDQADSQPAAAGEAPDGLADAPPRRAAGSWGRVVAATRLGPSAHVPVRRCPCCPSTRRHGRPAASSGRPG